MDSTRLPLRCRPPARSAAARRTAPNDAPSWSPKFRQMEPGSAADDLARAQFGQKVSRAFEVLHLDVNRSDLTQRMGIGACPWRGTQQFAELHRSDVDPIVRPAVPNLDDVDRLRDPFDGFF